MVQKSILNLQNKKGIRIMAKGVPKEDGSGGGTRNNRGRGGCPPSRRPSKGKGVNKK